MAKPVNSCNCECLSAQQVAQLKRETALDMDTLAVQVDDGQVCIDDLYNSNKDIFVSFLNTFENARGLGFDRAVTQLWFDLAGYECLPKPERQVYAETSHAKKLEARLLSSNCQEPAGKEFATLIQKTGGKVDASLLLICAIDQKHPNDFNLFKETLNPQFVADTIFRRLLRNGRLDYGPAEKWVKNYVADHLISPLLKEKYDEVGSFFRTHRNAENSIVGYAIMEALHKMPDPALAASRLSEVARLSYNFIARYLPEHAIKIYMQNEDLAGLIDIVKRHRFVSTDHWEKQLSFVLGLEPTVLALQYLDIILQRLNKDGHLLTDLQADYEKQRQSISDFVLRGVAGFQGKWPKDFVLGEPIARVVAPKLLPVLLARVSDGKVIVLNVTTNMDTCFFSNLVAGDTPLTAAELNIFFSRFSPDTPFLFNPEDESQVKALHRIMEWSADRLMHEKGLPKWRDYAKAVVLGARQLCTGPLKSSASCFEELELAGLQELYDLVYPSPPVKKRSDI